MQVPRHWVAMFGFPHPWYCTKTGQLSLASSQVGDLVGDGVGAGVGPLGGAVGDSGVLDVMFEQQVPPRLSWPVRESISPIALEKYPLCQGTAQAAQAVVQALLP